MKRILILALASAFSCGDPTYELICPVLHARDPLNRGLQEVIKEAEKKYGDLYRIRHGYACTYTYKKCDEDLTFEAEVEATRHMCRVYDPAPTLNECTRNNLISKDQFSSRTEDEKFRQYCILRIW